MRITNNMLVSNFMNNLNRNLYNMDKSQQKIASGKQFQLPSDNPIGASKSLKYHTDLSKLKQYEENVKDAKAWMKVTEDSLSQFGEIMKRTKELTVQALNSTNSEKDKKNISEEIEQLKEELVKVANATYAGKSIFTGFKTDGDLLDKDGLYKLTNYVDGTVGTPVSRVLDMDENIIYDVGVSDQINVNTIGIKLFGKLSVDPVTLEETNSYTDAVNGYTVDNTARVSDKTGADKSFVINLFESIKECMDTNDMDGLDNNLKTLEGVTDQGLKLRAEIGAKCNRLELTEKRIGNEKAVFEKLMTENEDVDLSEVIMVSKMQESVYNASLAVGTKIIQPSLIDFLR